MARPEFQTQGTFSGRVSKINPSASLLRVRVDFSNLKYLNLHDEVQVWSENFPSLKCQGKIQGKTENYLLILVPAYKECVTNINLSVGSHLYFYSEDLVKNLETGFDLVGILLKKRQATEFKVVEQKRAASEYLERTEVINKRYAVLKQKLDLEWQKEISYLEEDKLNSIKKLKELESELLDIDQKLERYKIEDTNLSTDRWALDKALYLKR